MARWLPVVVLTAVLAGINLGTRLVVRVALPSEDDQFTIGLLSIAAMLVAMAVGGFVWARRHLALRIFEDLAVAGGVGALIAVIFGPIVSGGSPFAAGFGFWLLLLLLCLVVLGLGGVLGVFLCTAFGMDPKTRAWRSREATGARRARESTREAERGEDTPRRSRRAGGSTRAPSRH